MNRFQTTMQSSFQKPSKKAQISHLKKLLTPVKQGENKANYDNGYTRNDYQPLTTK